MIRFSEHGKKEMGLSVVRPLERCLGNRVSAKMI